MILPLKKIAAGLVISTITGSAAWALAAVRRITVLETQMQLLQEIRADVKKLLTRP